MDARDHTGTNYLPDDKGVPIFWLGGDKTADDYEDLYDGGWDSNAPKDTAGNSVTRNTPVLTGCDSSGVEAVVSTPRGGVSHGLDRTVVAYGHADSRGEELLRPGLGTTGGFYYGLSPVFEVAVNSVPVFGSGVYSFSVAEDASVGDAVGAVSATDAGNGATATATANITVTDVFEDLDATRDGAVSLGAQSPDRGRQFFNNKALDRTSGDTVDYYTFTTDGRYTLGLGARGQVIELMVTVEDADGNTVATAGPPLNPNKDQKYLEWLEITIDAGTYYIRVEALEDGATDYNIRFGLTAPGG